MNDILYDLRLIENSIDKDKFSIAIEIDIKSIKFTLFDNKNKILFQYKMKKKKEDGEKYKDFFEFSERRSRQHPGKSHQQVPQSLKNQLLWVIKKLKV
jgi:hypothetical protein